MRRLFALVLAGMLLLLSGCSRLFEKEYVSTRDYEDPEPVENADTPEIHNYAGLARVLNAMVANFDTRQTLIFANYDGIIADDLSKACWELRTNTALGSFCVRDIEYTTEQVVIGGYLVAQAQDEFLTTGILLGYLAEHGGVGIYIDGIVGTLGLKGDAR